MSDENEAAAGLEEGVTREAAHEVTAVMEAVLRAATGASRHPGLAVTAIRVAARALRLAVSGTALEETEVTRAEQFADTLLTDKSVEREVVKLALTEVQHRCTRAAPTEDETRSTIEAAAACLDSLASAGHRHPVTALVILAAARHMALALLRHQYPDEYDDLRRVASAMENAIEPKSIAVVIMGANTVMSQGGDA